MKSSLLKSYVHQILLEAYSQGLYSKLIKKFQEESPGLPEKTAKYFIDTFDKNKDSKVIKANPKGSDILRYSWEELESLIKTNFDVREIDDPVVETDMEPVYKSPGGSIQIFLGDRREKCIKIKQRFESQTGVKYDWCISRTDPSNMFDTYRFRKFEPVFYYIFDTTRDQSDPLHACVIYVSYRPEKDELGNVVGKKKYFLATAKNTGDEEVTWQQITDMMPKLDNLENVFKYIPPTERELRIYGKVQNSVSDEDFIKFTRDEKEAYIAVGHKLTEDQIRATFSLPDGKELINKYANTFIGVSVPLDIYKKLPDSTKKSIKDGWLKGGERGISGFSVTYEGKTDFEGDLNLSDTPIDRLPRGLTVSGNLDLSKSTYIKNLPQGLKIGGDLDLSNTNIKTLPSDIQVGGKITPEEFQKQYEEIQASRSQSEVTSEALIRSFVRSVFI